MEKINYDFKLNKNLVKDVIFWAVVFLMLIISMMNYGDVSIGRWFISAASAWIAKNSFFLSMKSTACLLSCTYLLQAS